MLNCPKTCKQACRVDEILYTPASVEFYPVASYETSYGRTTPIPETSNKECPFTQICKSNYENSSSDNDWRLSFNGSFEGRQITFLHLQGIQTVIENTTLVQNEHFYVL